MTSYTSLLQILGKLKIRVAIFKPREPDTDSYYLPFDEKKHQRVRVQV